MNNRVSDEDIKDIMTLNEEFLAYDGECLCEEARTEGRKIQSALQELLNFRALYPNVRFKRQIVTPYGVLGEQ